jgi:hypothetical protein
VLRTNGRRRSFILDSGDESVKYNYVSNCAWEAPQTLLDPLPHTYTPSF